MNPERIDRYIASIPTQERSFRRRILRMCQRCGIEVGSDSLAVCIWPVKVQGTKVTDADRFGSGRIRLCEACATTTRASIRVAAHSWSSAKPRRQTGRGSSIAI